MTRPVLLRRLGLAAAAVLAVALSPVVNTGTSSAASSTIKIAPGSQSAVVGDTVTLTFSATDMVAVAGYDFGIQYDTSVLEYVNVEDLQFLGSTGRQASCPAPVTQKIDGTKIGKVQFGCGSIGQQPAGPSGSADLAKVTFKAIGDGTSDVVFWKADLSSPDGADCCGTPTLQEAAVAVGNNAPPPKPEPPAPDPGRLTRNRPSPTDIPVFEVLPDETSGGAGSGSADETGSGAVRSSTNSGSNRSASERAGRQVRSGTAASGSGNDASSSGTDSSGFPVAGTGYQESSGGTWLLYLGYAFAATGVALVAVPMACQRSRDR
jgi:hypothetical protein